MINLKKEHPLQIGQLVKIRKGRDAGQAAVVVRLDEEQGIWIADGHKRKFDRPKKKNRLHLESQATISSEVVNSLQESGRVTNAKLRHAVNVFLESDAHNVKQKGE